MGAPPYALSISHFVSSVGADAGFAAIVGLAILILLYFAQARETASLRDRFAEAAEQLRQLELRVAHLSRPAPAPAAQATTAPRPAAQATTTPRPAAAAVAAPMPSRAVRALPISEVPMAPAGVGAPALSAATRLIPSGDAGAIAIRPGAGRVGVGVAVGAGAGAGAGASAGAGVAVAEADGRGDGPEASAGGGVMAPPGPGPATAAGATAAGATGTGAATGGGGPAGGSNGGGRTPAPAAAPGVGERSGPDNGGSQTAAPQRPSQDPNRPYRIAGARPSGQSRPPRRPVAPPPPAQRWRLPRALIIVVGLIIVAAIVAGFFVLTSTSGPSTKAQSGTSPAVSNAPSTHRRKTRGAALKPAQVTVAVLNGTSTSNLAHDVSLKLTNSGYKQGTIATATDQTQAATTVGYLPGQRRAALIVARSLNLGATAIQPVTQVNQAVACPQASCTAQVVVTVGSDLASAASTSPAPTPAPASSATATG